MLKLNTIIFLRTQIIAVFIILDMYKDKFVEI